MKKAIICMLAASFALTTPVIVSAQTPPPPSAQQTAVTNLVAAIRRAPASDRQRMVQDAINANPSIASALVASLIAAFPTEAAVFTKTVVDSVVGLTIATEQKSEILTAVASAAVPAALQIPAAAVTDLVASVNAVKEALANVPPEFTPAVEQYVVPITADSKEIIVQNEQQDPEVVSPDTL